MGAANKVIAGDYEGGIVRAGSGGMVIQHGVFKSIKVNKKSIESYERITEESTKSASSAVMRGALGAFLLGPVGLLAGASAKNKGVYTIALLFKDGKKSLIEIDDQIYKVFIKAAF